MKTESKLLRHFIKIQKRYAKSLKQSAKKYGLEGSFYYALYHEIRALAVLDILKSLDEFNKMKE